MKLLSRYKTQNESNRWDLGFPILPKDLIIIVVFCLVRGYRGCLSSPFSSRLRVSCLSKGCWNYRIRSNTKFPETAPQIPHSSSYFYLHRCNWTYNKWPLSAATWMGRWPEFLGMLASAPRSRRRVRQSGFPPLAASSKMEAESEAWPRALAPKRRKSLLCKKTLSHCIAYAFLIYQHYQKAIIKEPLEQSTTNQRNKKCTSCSRPVYNAVGEGRNAARSL